MRLQMKRTWALHDIVDSLNQTTIKYLITRLHIVWNYKYFCYIYFFKLSIWLLALDYFNWHTYCGELTRIFESIYLSAGENTLASYTFYMIYCYEASSWQCQNQDPNNPDSKFMFFLCVIQCRHVFNILLYSDVKVYYPYVLAFCSCLKNDLKF